MKQFIYTLLFFTLFQSTTFAYCEPISDATDCPKIKQSFILEEGETLKDITRDSKNNKYLLIQKQEKNSKTSQETSKLKITKIMKITPENQIMWSQVFKAQANAIYYHKKQLIISLSYQSPFKIQLNSKTHAILSQKNSPIFIKLDPHLGKPVNYLLISSLQKIKSFFTEIEAGKLYLLMHYPRQFRFNKTLHRESKLFLFDLNFKKQKVFYTSTIYYLYLKHFKVKNDQAYLLFQNSYTEGTNFNVLNLKTSKETPHHLDEDIFQFSVTDQSLYLLTEKKLMKYTLQFKHLKTESIHIASTDKDSSFFLFFENHFLLLHPISIEYKSVLKATRYDINFKKQAYQIFLNFPSFKAKNINNQLYLFSNSNQRTIQFNDFQFLNLNQEHSFFVELK